MDMYPAIEMMPVYNTFLILMNMFCGTVILNESSMYTVGELLLLCLFSSICIIGIFVLVKKPELTCTFGEKEVAEQHPRIELTKDDDLLEMKSQERANFIADEIDGYF